GGSAGLLARLGELAGDGRFGRRALAAGHVACRRRCRDGAARWRRGDRARAEVPHHAIDAGLALAVDLANDFAVLVGDGDADALLLLGLRLQVVRDERPVGRIRSEEESMAGVAAAIGDAPLRRWPQIEQMQILGEKAVGELLE